MTENIMKLFPFVFLGGGFGATLRWLISLIVSSMQTRFWVGTLIANLLGCVLFFIGVKYLHFEGRFNASFYRIGLLGSLTTFSTFSFELVSLLREGLFKEFAICFFLNIFFGIVMGIWILR